MSKIRLFTPNFSLSEAQSHYLSAVMRLNAGDKIYVFNGIDGEFEAELTRLSKKEGAFKLLQKTAEFRPAADMWLLFAPLKKDRTDFVIEKATELGAARLMPIKTQHTASDKVRAERLRMQAIEAAEQCRRTEVPEVDDLMKLDEVLAGWDSSRTLYFMDESGAGKPPVQAFVKAPAAILVGPEGGFSSNELDILRKQSYTVGVSLGKRILRAETAVLAALSCWQALCGDWNEN